MPPIEEDEKSERHFETLESNFNQLIKFCESEAKPANAVFSTPTVLKKDFDFVKTQSTKQIVQFRLSNPTIGEDDVFIARFSKFTDSRQTTCSVKISSMLVMENFEMAKEQIIECLHNLKVETSSS